MEKETGFTLGYDKYNWEEHPDHFLLADCTKPVDFGEGKKSVYALPGIPAGAPEDGPVEEAAVLKAVGQAGDVHRPALAEGVYRQLDLLVPLDQDLRAGEGADGGSFPLDLAANEIRWYEI